MASFAQTGDPNAHKATNASVAGVPSINDGKDFLVRTDAPGVDRVDMLEKRCSFWLQHGSKIPV